jgi:tetratricopeptide (TPR) repeat protein
MLLGTALVEAGQVQEGLSHMEEAVRLDPADVNARFNLGLALQRQGRLDDARKQLEEALRLDPEHVDAQLVLGVIEGTEGRHERAAQRFEAVLQNKPDHDEGQFNLGVALNMLGRPAEALVRLRESLRLRPDVPERMIYLAGLLATHADASVRDPEEAIRIAEEAVELTGRRDAVALDTLAAAYASAGRFDDAARTAEEALARANAAGAGAYARDIAARRDLYRQGRPYIAPGR